MKNAPYRTLKAGHQNNVPINDVAKFYLENIKANNIKVLNFHPLKKSSAAVSNQFRLAVLKHLTHNDYYQAHTDKRELEIATQAALEAGYTINEVPAHDYDRKIYLPPIKVEAVQYDLLQAA